MLSSESPAMYSGESAAFARSKLCIPAGSVYVVAVSGKRTLPKKRVVIIERLKVRLKRCFHVRRFFSEGTLSDCTSVRYIMSQKMETEMLTRG